VDANTFATADETLGDPAENLTIGLAGTGDDMVGDIAEVAMWNRVLTAAEFAILKLYSPMVIPRGLIFYAPIIRDTHDVISGHIGTVTGASVAVHPPLIYPSPPQIITVPAAAGPTVPDQTLAPTSQFTNSGGMIGRTYMKRNDVYVPEELHDTRS